MIHQLSILLQVTVPLGFYEKLPVSVSFIARHGGDHFLLNTVQSMYATLHEQIDLAMKSNISHVNNSKEESAEVTKEKVSYYYFQRGVPWHFYPSFFLANSIYFFKTMILLLPERMAVYFHYASDFMLLVLVICGSDCLSIFLHFHVSIFWKSL